MTHIKKTISDANNDKSIKENYPSSIPMVAATTGVQKFEKKEELNLSAAEIEKLTSSIKNIDTTKKTKEDLIKRGKLTRGLNEMTDPIELQKALINRKNI